MVTLDTTKQLETSSVLLQITDAVDGPLVITRSDVNGVAPVRLRQGQEPIAGALTVVDYEVALDGYVGYSVLDAAGFWDDTALVLGATAPVLNVPVLPQYTATLEAVTGYEGRRAPVLTVHDVIGRGDPVVVSTKTARSRSGTLEIRSTTYAAAAEIQSVLTRGYVCLLRQADQHGLDMYFVALDVRLAPDEMLKYEWSWVVFVDYVEVRTPSSPQLGAAGWTFDDLAGEATFSALPELYETFADLAVGP